MGEVFDTRRQSLRSVLVGLGTAVTFAGAQAQGFPPENPPCPTSVLAPSNLNPVGKSNIDHCPTTPNCLVNFKNYQWWTAYQFPFFNGGLHTPFAPEHAFIGGDGNLHLRANNDVDLGAGKVWSGAEAVLMFNQDGSEANLGYGDYLVTTRLVNGTWDALDINMAHGLFTYENPATGDFPNTTREIDLAEISRWGWNHTGTCPIGGNNGGFDNSYLCKGNAQFALQEIMNSDKNTGPFMVSRYNIGNNNLVTLVMRWHGGNQRVIFEKYTGAVTLGNLPSAPTYAWATDPAVNPTPPNFKTEIPSTVNSFIPAHTPTSCERFHINFWFGNYSAGQNPNPPPSSPQELIITNFQFSPSTTPLPPLPPVGGGGGGGSGPK